MAKKPFVLIICDGWGEVAETAGNAIAAADTPQLDQLRKRWPHTIVAASGEAVGLPAGQQGNSEVGHLTIGAGRIIRQPLSRQHHAIDSGIFYENEVLIEAIELAKQRGRALHILGLVSPGGVHSHSNGALALVRLAKQLELDNVHVHAFTDGRDTPPMSFLDHLQEFETELANIGAGRIASIAGRYYAMDRDNRWDRIALAYDMLTGDDHATAPNTKEHIQASYEQGETDEFLRPISIASRPQDRTRIEDGDVVVFFNFRPDRARQLSHALVDKQFTGFSRKRIVKDLHFVSFAEYDKELGVPVAFPKEDVKNTLAEVISSQGLKQYHVAETEKYAHVTYFLNGGREQAFDGEERHLIPSPRVATYDLKPEMSAADVASDVVDRINEGSHDLIVVNFANADMVGHTGDLEATKKAISVLDGCLGHVITATLKAKGVALMTADHGNAEYKIDRETGKPLTAHTTSPVPVLICGQEGITLRDGGGLADIAPTVLGIMGVPKPADMTGTSLIR
ncbi:MAG TPA: 2,3-bisphosphoglycerate-independent phosphoglycerate mutase [Candidatus Saccharimonadales bacterium]|nr:2,3-bisphosphoglycerate-independent phosphoglycerate mutase [Candidatus Saccharimonadales bacterium]